MRGQAVFEALIRDPPTTTTSTCLSWARTKASPQVPSLSNKPLPLLEALVGL